MGVGRVFIGLAGGVLYGILVVYRPVYLCKTILEFKIVPVPSDTIL